MSQYKEKNTNINLEHLIESIENLTFKIENTRNKNNDYSSILINIFTALKEIGNGFKNDGCLNKIHHELRILNKTLIMSALLISATQNPEKTLNEYNKILEQYLN